MIYLGAEFNSYEAFDIALKEYQASNLTQFSKVNSERISDGDPFQETLRYHVLRLQCKQGQQRESKAKERPRQRSYKVGCPVSLNLRLNRPKNQPPFLKVTRLVEDHAGHNVTREVFDLYPEQRRIVTDDKDMILSGVPHYNQEALDGALDKIREKHMSIKGASQHYGVPCATLSDKLRGRRPVKSRPRITFTHEEEAELVAGLFELLGYGVWQTQSEVRDKIKQFLDSKKINSVFKNNRPGKLWMTNFLRRHPDIAHKIVRGVRSDIIPATRHSLISWFDDITLRLDRIDPSILQTPERIYTASEFVFNINPETEAVEEICDPRDLVMTKRTVRKNVTVWGCIAASGISLPPIAVYWKTMQARSRSHPRHALTEQVLLNFLKENLVPSISGKKPVVLFTTGLSTACHAKHVTEKCGENVIVLQTLNSKENYLIQAMYQAFFQRFRSAWSEVSLQELGTLNVKMEQFSFILKKAWDIASQSDVIKQSFKQSGIYPLDPNSILNCDKLQPTASYMGENNSLEDKRVSDLLLIFPTKSETDTMMEVENAATSDNVLSDGDADFTTYECEINVAEPESDGNTAPNQHDAGSTATQSLDSSSIVLNFHDYEPVSMDITTNPTTAAVSRVKHFTHQNSSVMGDQPSIMTSTSTTQKSLETSTINSSPTNVASHNQISLLNRPTPFSTFPGHGFTNNQLRINTSSTSMANKPPISLLSKIFELMKFNFRLGEEKAVKFMKFYKEKQEILNDASYESWKSLMDGILAQMHFNFEIGEGKVTTYMEKYANEWSQKHLDYIEWKGLMDNIMSDCDGSNTAVQNDPLFKQWKNMMDNVLSHCRPVTSQKVPPQTASTQESVQIELEEPSVLVIAGEKDIISSSTGFHEVTVDQATVNQGSNGHSANSYILITDKHQTTKHKSHHSHRDRHSSKSVKDIHKSQVTNVPITKTQVTDKHSTKSQITDKHDTSKSQITNSSKSKVTDKYSTKSQNTGKHYQKNQL